jgi:hypothetical protein
VSITDVTYDQIHTPDLAFNPTKNQVYSVKQQFTTTAALTSATTNAPLTDYAGEITFTGVPVSVDANALTINNSGTISHDPEPTLVSLLDFTATDLDYATTYTVSIAANKLTDQ